MSPTMSPEERQKLIARFKSHEVVMWTDIDLAAEELERQSDAPWQCPIGIPPESHSICSAGTCWWCLADRVKAQSDAEPLAKHPLGPGGKPMMDWYYDDDGVCRPSPPAPPRPDTSAGLIEAAEELADLMDDVVRGHYKPDSFTTQPLRRALRALAAGK